MLVSFTPMFISFVSDRHIYGDDMPQVTCPNCGTTINLENRKEIDYGLIKSAVGREPQTFTDLLHYTKLSRKTLSLRLSALCGEGAVLKEDGKYMLNGKCVSESRGGHFAQGVSRVFSDRKVRTGVMLVALLVFSSVSSYVLASYFTLPKNTVQEPVVIGKFTMALDVSNVTDLYGWQVNIGFNSSQMKVLDTSPGDFLGADFPGFVNSTDTESNTLLLAETLKGDVPGKSTDGTPGRLATIIFGYYEQDYDEPRINVNQATFTTFLTNSALANIPIGSSTLVLSTVES
jgi:hypothetical protein